MNIEQLKSFLLVAKYKNFTKAAQQLHIGQPALSRQIADLEKQFDVLLFNRNNRVVELTLAGEILYKDGQKIIDKIDTLKHRMNNASNGIYGHLNISLLGNYKPQLSSILKEAIAQLPHISISIERLNLDEMGDALINMDVDIALTFEYGLKNVKDEIDYVPVIDMPFRLLVPQGHELSSYDTIKLSDLQNKRIIIFRTAYNPKFLYKLFNQSILHDHQNVIESINMDSLILKVNTGQGIGLVPEFIACSINDYDFTIKTISDIDTSEKIVLAWNVENNNPAVKKFVKAYTDLLNQ